MLGLKFKFCLYPSTDQMFDFFLSASMSQPQKKTYQPTKSFSLRRRKTYRGAYTRGERSFSVEIASPLLLFSFFSLLIFLSQKQNVHFLEGTRIGLDVLLNGFLWWHGGEESTGLCR